MFETHEPATLNPPPSLDTLSPPQKTERRRVIVIFAIVISLLVQFGVVWMVRNKINAGFSDFCTLYTAGKIVSSPDSSRLYDLDLQRNLENSFKSPAAQTTFLPYNHAPFEALFFAQLARFSYPTAFWIFWAMNVPIVFLVFFLLRSAIPNVFKSPDLAILALAVFQPLLDAEGQGQDSIITLLLFALCFLNLTRGRPWVAGAALGLATYKPQYAIVMIAILVITSDRRWRILAGFVSSCLCAAALSLVAVGWHTTIGFPRFLRTFAAHYDDVRDRTGEMPNLRGLAYTTLSPHLSHQALTLLIQAISLVALVLTIWALRRNGGIGHGFSLKFALAITYVFVFAYYAFFHDMTMLLIPILLVWNSLAGDGIGTLRRKMLGAAMLILLCGGLLSILIPPVFASVSIVFFVLLLLEVLKMDAAPAMVAA